MSTPNESPTDPLYASEIVEDYVLNTLPRAPYRAFPARQAELLKLATNAFYSLKVSFANMLYDCGATQEMLDALAADPRIVASHFTVEHKGYRGFGGKCLPKDTRALSALASYTLAHPVLTFLLDTILDYNKRLTNGKDQS